MAANLRAGCWSAPAAPIDPRGDHRRDLVFRLLRTGRRPCLRRRGVRHRRPTREIYCSAPQDHGMGSATASAALARSWARFGPALIVGRHGTSSPTTVAPRSTASTYCCCLRWRTTIISSASNWGKSNEQIDREPTAGNRPTPTVWSRTGTCDPDFTELVAMLWMIAAPGRPAVRPRPRTRSRRCAACRPAC